MGVEQSQWHIELVMGVDQLPCRVMQVDQLPWRNASWSLFSNCISIVLLFSLLIRLKPYYRNPNILSFTLIKNQFSLLISFLFKNKLDYRIITISQNFKSFSNITSDFGKEIILAFAYFIISTMTYKMFCLTPKSFYVRKVLFGYFLEKNREFIYCETLYFIVLFQKKILITNNEN